MLSNKFMYTKEDNEFDSSSDVIPSVDGDENAAISFSSDDDTAVSLEQLDTSIRNYLNGYLAVSNARAYTIKRNDDPHALKALNTTLEMVNSTLRLKSEDTYVITVECTTYLKYTIALEASDSIISKIWEGIKTFFKKIWDGITSLFTKSESKNAETIKKVEATSAEIVNLQKQVETATANPASGVTDPENQLSAEASMELVKPLSGFIYKNPNLTIQQLQKNLVEYFAYTVSDNHPIRTFLTTLTNTIAGITSIIQKIPSGPVADTSNVTKMTSSEAEVKINEILLKNNFATYTGLASKLSIDTSKLNGDTTIFSNKYYIPIGIKDDTIFIYTIGTRDFPGEDKDRYKSSIEKFTIKQEVYSNIRLPVMKLETDIKIYNDTIKAHASAITASKGNITYLKNKTQQMIDQIDSEIKKNNENVPRNFIDFANTMLTGYMSAINIHSQCVYGNDLTILNNYFDAVREHFAKVLEARADKQLLEKAEKAEADKAAAEKAEADKAAAAATAAAVTPEPAQVEKKKGLISKAWDSMTGGKK